MHTTHSDFLQGCDPCHDLEVVGSVRPPISHLGCKLWHDSNVYTPFEGIVPFRACTIGDMVFSGAPVLYDHVEDAAHWDENPGLCCPCLLVLFLLHLSSFSQHCSLRP
ncbi:hypothetical protein QL285_013810 [Trifolium repens]|nr:hypothetical protein QL285_013810 [Trifolium repens]